MAGSRRRRDAERSGPGSIADGMVIQPSSIKLYHAEFSRSERIRWLLEELELPYELVNVEFVQPTNVFSQATPSGKLPVIEDGDLLVSESGAIVEYLIDSRIEQLWGVVRHAQARNAACQACGSCTAWRGCSRPTCRRL